MLIFLLLSQLASQDLNEKQSAFPEYSFVTFDNSSQWDEVYAKPVLGVVTYVYGYKSFMRLDEKCQKVNFLTEDGSHENQCIPVRNLRNIDVLTEKINLSVIFILFP